MFGAALSMFLIHNAIKMFQPPFSETSFRLPLLSYYLRHFHFQFVLGQCIQINFQTCCYVFLYSLTWGLGGFFSNVSQRRKSEGYCPLYFVWLAWGEREWVGWIGIHLWRMIMYQYPEPQHGVAICHLVTTYSSQAINVASLLLHQNRTGHVHFREDIESDNVADN